jgi:hypothetical protein
MSKLSKQLVTLARQGGGGFKTIADRSKIATRVAERIAKLNIQIRDVKHINQSSLSCISRVARLKGYLKEQCKMRWLQ